MQTEKTSISISVPNTYLSTAQRKDYIREQQINKYYNWLMHIYNQCRDGYISFNHADSAKRWSISANAYLELNKLGYLKSIGENKHKRWNWKVNKPTEEMAEKIWNKTKDTQRLYTFNKKLLSPPKSKSGKSMVPIIKNVIIKNQINNLEKMKTNRISKTPTAMLDFLKELHAECQSGNCKGINSIRMKYGLAAATTTAILQNGMVTKSLNGSLEWKHPVPPNEETSKHVANLIVNYNKNHLISDKKLLLNKNQTIKQNIEIKNITSIPKNDVVTEKNEINKNDVKIRLAKKFAMFGQLDIAEKLLDEVK